MVHGLLMLGNPSRQPPRSIARITVSETREDRLRLRRAVSIEEHPQEHIAKIPRKLGVPIDQRVLSDN